MPRIKQTERAVEWRRRTTPYGSLWATQVCTDTAYPNLEHWTVRRYGEEVEAFGIASTPLRGLLLDYVDALFEAHPECNPSVCHDLEMWYECEACKKWHTMKASNKVPAAGFTCVAIGKKCRKA